MSPKKISPVIPLAIGLVCSYDIAQRNSKKLLPQDPRYFVGQATSVLFAKDNTAEFQILKREIVKWKSRDQGEVAAGGAEM